MHTKNVELGSKTRYSVVKRVVRKHCDIAKAYRGCGPITAKDFMQVHATVYIVEPALKLRLLQS